MEGKEDEELLLWQRACFFEGQTPRSKADSLRLRIRHLHHSYQSSSQPSPGVGGSQLLQLLRFHQNQYSSIVDNQDTATGLNNYAESIQSLINPSTNAVESKEWRSGLTVEEVMAMPSIQKSMKNGLVRDAPFPVPKDPAQLPPIPAITRPHPHSLHHPVTTSSKGTYMSHDHHMTNSTVSSGQHQFQYQQVPIPVVHNETDQSPNRFSKGKGSGYSSGKGRGYSRGQKRCRNQGSDESEGEESSSSKGCGQDFVTAKDQYIIDQKKKFGKMGGARGGASSNDKDIEIEVSAYGNSKKSLGTRRTTGNPFVPPVKKNNNPSSDEISSRVLYNNGKGGSTKGSASLPPELEGNELLKNIEPRMVELIMNEIMDHGSPIDWDDIAGLQFVKDTIKEIVVWPMMRPDIFKGLRGPPKGILLFGPPGTGKTLIGKCVASQVKATFFSISASSLTSKWVGEGEKMVRALFSVARCFQPAVVFIDEIDSLLSQRSDTEHESSRRIKTEFLVQLDGAGTNAEDRLLVIGATNRPQEIDEAARRRLVKRLYIPLPDAIARKEIVMNLLKEQQFSLSEDDTKCLCEASHGYSGADMANLCREAALGPIRDAAHNIQHILPDEVRPVTYKDFEEAFHIIRPSVSEKDLEIYTDWNEKYGCGNRR